MRLRSRGLLVDGIDRDLYVPRPSLQAAILDPVLSGGNVLVLGPRGSGKTTSLRRLALDLRARDESVAVVNATMVGTAAELLAAVSDAITGRRNAAMNEARSPLDLLRELKPLVPSCVLVDGPVPSAVGRELFGRLRDEVWALEHRWAVTSTKIAASSMRLPPADAFWDRVVQLPALDANEVDGLLRRGLDADERTDLLEGGWQPPSSPWPRAVVRSVRQWLEGTGLQPADEVDALRERRATLRRVPSMVLAELEDLHRPAAAGDPELLERLGYSRAYVARALAELEGIGLVVSAPEAMEGSSGRPRKLYEPLLKDGQA